MSVRADELERRRLMHLVDQLTEQLQERRSITHGTDYVEDGRAARAAGRRLGLRIRVGRTVTTTTSEVVRRNDVVFRRLSLIRTDGN